MLWMTGIIALGFLILGLVLRSGRGMMLIAGYNTMPKEAQDAVDKRLLGRTVGNLLLRLALYAAVIGVGFHFGLQWLGWIGIAGMSIDPIATVLWINCKMPNIHSAEREKTPKRTVAFVVILLTVTALGTGGMFYFGEKEPVVTLQADQMRIEGMYGMRVALEDIQSIELLEASLRDIGIKTRTNGYGGASLKGHFTLDSGEACRLYVKSRSTPTILIRIDGGENIYLNLVKPEATQALYEQLAQVVGHGGA